MKTSDEPAVVLRGITKTYRGQTAVDGIDLQVARGEMVALLGPNGAGKSTTTEIMLGLTRPDRGDVRICGQSPEQATRAGLVGAMLQNGALLEDTPVRLLLQLLGGVCAHPLPLDDVVEAAEIGSLLRKNTSRLSGGEAQRVRFAVALLPDPDVILLDEPTVAMDVETRHRFWQRMRAAAGGGRTVLFATHYLDEADQVSDRVVVLDRGRMVADGTGTEIKQRIGGRAITLRTARDPQRFAALPGVTSADRIGHDRLRLATEDSDRTLGALFAPGGPVDGGEAGDVEVTAPSLEDAFVQLVRH